MGLGIISAILLEVLLGNVVALDGDVYICWAIYQWLSVIRIKLGSLRPE